MPKHRKRSILGSLIPFGVAFVLISTAGAASAQEAPPTAPSSDEATLGEPTYVERPAPRPDPANELGAEAAPADPTPARTSTAAAPAPAPQPTPAPAPAATVRTAPRRSPVATASPQAAPAPVAVQSAPAPQASSAPARATEVQGVQIVRPAAPGDATDAALAFTGTADQEVGLTVLAGGLLALGWALVRVSRSPRLA